MSWAIMTAVDIGGLFLLYYGIGEPRGFRQGGRDGRGGGVYQETH